MPLIPMALAAGNRLLGPVLSSPWVWAALFLAFTHGAVWWETRAAGKRALDAAQVRWQADVLRARDEARAAAERVVTRTEVVYRDRVQKVEVRGRDIVERIPEYIVVGGQSSCPSVSGGFVVLHDAAATNHPPRAAEPTDGAAAGITEAQTLATVAENYTEYHRCAEKLRGWQQFYKDLQTVYRNEPARDGRP